MDEYSGLIFKSRRFRMNEQKMQVEVEHEKGKTTSRWSLEGADALVGGVTCVGILGVLGAIFCSN